MPLAQPRLATPRLRAYSALEARINQAVEREAARFGVSKSFVIAVGMADVLGVKLEREFRYQTASVRPRKTKKTKK